MREGDVGEIFVVGVVMWLCDVGGDGVVMRFVGSVGGVLGDIRGVWLWIELGWWFLVWC